MYRKVGFGGPEEYLKNRLVNSKQRLTSRRSEKGGANFLGWVRKPK